MTGLAQLLADCEERGIQLLPASDGGLTGDAPNDALTPDLIERLAAHKGKILPMLVDRPVTQDDRRQAYESLIARVNAGYQGGPIDWPRLDVIEQRIWKAITMAELRQAAANYESVALASTDTGQFGQHS